MKFDTVIIGGGLSGLTCGLRLSQQGLRCAIISRGQSGLHFSSGSLDLLNHSGNLSNALQTLAAQEPNHPYSLVGEKLVLDYARQAEQMLAEMGIAMHGTLAQPHQRITPLGTTRQAWLTPQEVARLPFVGTKVAVVGISGFADFESPLAAASLRKSGAEADALDITLPALDGLRDNASEFRSVTLARLLDDGSQWQALLNELEPIARRYDQLLLPACFGLQDDRLWQWLNEKLPCPLALIPTLPPSVPGFRLHDALQRQFVKQGGVWLAGDAVREVVCEDEVVSAIQTRNHAEIPLRTRFAVLASGSFFSNGLIASREGVTEPVLGVDILQTLPRDSWYQRDFFTPQPWQRFGVKTDASLRPSRNGQPFANLFAIGGILGGFDAISQGCGGGVSVITALHAAQHILDLAGEQP